MAVRKRRWVTRKGEEREAWICQYIDADGIDRIHTSRTKKEADAYQDKVRIDVRKGMHTPPSKSATVAEAAESWFDAVKANGMRGHGPAERTTLRQYRQHINLHIVPRIGAVKLAGLTPKLVEKFQKDLLETVNRPTAKKVFTSFKSILKAAKYGHVAEGLSIGTEKRKRRLEAGRDIPTTAEIKRLIDAAKDDRRRALLLTATLTGLRASELRGLRWSDVNLKTGELHVCQRADRYNEIGAPKSDASARTVPLDQQTIAALKVWKLACPKGEAGVVFPSSTGQIEHHSNMLKGLAHVMKAAGVVDSHGKPKYALHAFRHFFASWCINRKVDGGRELPPKVVQHLLGHSSIVMTLDRYGHLFPRGDDRAELDASARTLLG
jgi:integrase